MDGWRPTAAASTRPRTCASGCSSPSRQRPEDKLGPLECTVSHDCFVRNVENTDGRPYVSARSPLNQSPVGRNTCARDKALAGWEYGMRRVVVTGMGIVSSIGNNTQEVLASLREAKSGITKAEPYEKL